jgi:inner membrane protein
LNATTHAVFGIAALAGAALVTGADPPAYVYPAAVAAAWLPDIDNPRSTLGNGLNRLKNPTLNLLSRPLSWTLKSTSFVLVRSVGHRTMTHSLAGILLFSLLVLLFLGRFPNLVLALVAGYASHVFADALNTRGVPLLWPMGKPFRLLPGGCSSPRSPCLHALRLATSLSWIARCDRPPANLASRGSQGGWPSLALRCGQWRAAATPRLPR